MKTDKKELPTDSIANIKLNNADSSGNKIVYVFATGNEYAIYEIETAEPENRLRVLIDGLTNKSEAKLTKRFSSVKQNYVLAKGLLYRSSNFNLMKNRIAHALASTLNGHEKKPNAIFEKLIKEIRDEYKSILIRRLVYILPAYAVLLLLAGCSLFNIYLTNFLKNSYLTELLGYVAMASLGGALSMTYSLKKIVFEAEPSSWYYVAIGAERLFLSLAASIILFMAVKAEILGKAITGNTYNALFAAIVAGFSETLAPSLLQKQEKKT